MYKVSTKKFAYSRKQAGFTIVELMIATMVFSVILVVITVGVMYFTRSYYKGVYAGMTQNAARDVAEAVNQAVQFGTGTPVTYEYNDGDSGVKFICAGGYVFVFNLGEQYDVDNPGTKGMYMQPIPSTGCEEPHDSIGRQQLLGNRMRITYLNFIDAGGLFTLDVKVAYGENDLLSNDQGLGPDVQCNLGPGSEYCAVARYTSSVSQRKT